MTQAANTNATSMAGESGLPDFSNPPVDETALSLQFPKIVGLGIPHFGLYWERIRSEYPRFEVQPPIPAVTENLATGFRPAAFGLELMSMPEVRCWFLDDPGNKVIQLQDDRFIVNWRRVKGDEPYPRYPVLRERLEQEWARFHDFLLAEKLELPKVNQCEVTYVNSIEYDKGWSGYGELNKVVAALATPISQNQFLPAPERVNMHVMYRLEGNAGRLYVSFVPVIRGRDGKEVLQMTLVARGAPKSHSIDDVLSWLDLGRRWVVRGFADFTSEHMHEVWGKK